MELVVAAASVAVALVVAVAASRAIGAWRARALAAETRAAELQQQMAVWKEGEGKLARLYADASHDLRAPISILIANLEETLEGKTLDAAGRRDVARIRVVADALERRVDDLLTRARADAGEIGVRLARHDVAAIVRHSCASFEPLANKRGLRFVVDIPDVLEGNVDREMLERIVLNLLFNAFKMTPPAGTIRCAITAEDGGGAMRLVVSDSGPGVPPHRRPMIFERRIGGVSEAGLGLHLSRACARMHGGDITVDDAVEGGARFTATLRLDHSSPGQPAQPSLSTSSAPQRIAAIAEAELGVPPPTADSAGEDRGRVLVVEDEPDVALVIKRCLEKSFDVVVAADGRKALEVALAEKPDLILTDIALPEMNGEELLQALRNDAELSGIPVVVLTARDDHALRVRMLQLGAQDFLTKPFQPLELLQRSKNQVEQKRARDILAREVSARRTDLASLARAVSEHRRQLEDAVAQLAVARDLAEAGSRAKSNFLRMMSHEVRTPIAALEIHLSALMSHAHEQLDADGRKHVRGMGRASTRLIEIVETVVEWARIDAGRFLAQPKPFSLGELAQEVASDFSAHAELKGLALQVDVPTELPALLSDRRVARLVAVNLVGNAVKYTPRGSVIVRVTMREREREQVLEIQDTGPGIPKEFHQSIFEPFRQLEDVGRTHGAGSGLGLAIVKDLVEAIRGRIELDSDAGKGTRVIVTLPALDDVKAAAAE